MSDSASSSSSGPSEKTPPKLPDDPTTQRPKAESDSNAGGEPIRGMTGVVESILRKPSFLTGQLRQESAGGLLRHLLLLLSASGLVYGVIMGSFSGGMQLWAAPLKVVLGLTLSALICLPSLYIFSCLCGSVASLRHVICLLAGAIALMTVLLIGFVPVAWIFSQSTESIPAMGFIHLLFWIVAVWFGMRFLLQGFKEFETRLFSGLHVWIFIFFLVTLQMTAALRPLIGTSQTLLPVEKKFFMIHWLETMSES